MPFIEPVPASQLANLRQQQELLGRAGEDQRREAQRVLLLARGERCSTSPESGGHAAPPLDETSRTGDGVGAERHGEQPTKACESSSSATNSFREMSVSSPAPPLRSASKEMATPRDQVCGEGNTRALEREAELLHQVARLTLSSHEDRQEARERERELEMRIAGLRSHEENRQKEQALELALQQKILESLQGQVDYVNNTCSKIAGCEMAMDRCESCMQELVRVQSVVKQQVGGERKEQRRRREEKKQRVMQRIATLEVATAFDSFIVNCRASQEEKRLCKRVVDSVVLKNGKDLIMAEQALEECKAALAAAEFNLENSQRCAKESQGEVSPLSRRTPFLFGCLLV